MCPPLYDWKCLVCERLVTVSRSMADYKLPPDACDCGNSGSETGFERVIDRSSANFVLKGDGWHRDLYSRTGRPIK